MNHKFTTKKPVKDNLAKGETVVDKEQTGATPSQKEIDNKEENSDKVALEIADLQHSEAVTLQNEPIIPTENHPLVNLRLLFLIF